MEVGRQGADFLDLGGRADEEVRGLVVQSSQSPNDIPDVCAHAELGHPPNVDGDLHGRQFSTRGPAVAGSSWKWGGTHPGQTESPPRIKELSTIPTPPGTSEWALAAESFAEEFAHGPAVALGKGLLPSAHVQPGRRMVNGRGAGRSHAPHFPV